MRVSKAVAVGMLAVIGTAGCAFRERQWGTCAVGGALVGGAIGGITGGVTTNNAIDDATDEERGAGIGGGIVAGAALGALLGHALCDPVKEPPKVAQVPPPPPPPPAKKIVELSAAHFDFDRATLRPEGRRVVDEAVAVLKAESDVRVSVEGHTDSVGSDAYNEDLSQRRADAVRDYMVEQGIAASRITTRGWGESKPIASNDTAEGRAQNRRVEIIRQ